MDVHPMGYIRMIVSCCDGPTLVTGNIECLAHILMHPPRRMSRNIVRPGCHREGCLVDPLNVPFRIHRHLAGKHDQRNSSAYSSRQRCHDLGKSRSAGHRGDADIAGGAVIAHRHSAGAMLVANMDHAYAVHVLHRRCPMHVAVAHKREEGSYD